MTETRVHLTRAVRAREAAWHSFCQDRRLTGSDGERLAYNRGYADGRKSLLAAAWGYCTVVSALAVTVLIVVALVRA